MTFSAFLIAAGVRLLPGRLFVLAAVVLFVLGLLFSGTTMAQESEPNADAEQSEEEAAEDEESSGGGGKSIFLTLEPLVAPVLDERSIKGNITVVIKLFIINPVNEEKIRVRIPKLSDAYLNYFYRYGSSAASSGTMQLDAIVRSLQRLSDKILGKQEVQVLLHEVSRTRSK
jgi:hypothetical protein